MVSCEVLLLEVVVLPFLFVKFIGGFDVQQLLKLQKEFSFAAFRRKFSTRWFDMTSCSECMVYRTLSRNAESIYKSVSQCLKDFVNVVSTTKLSTLLETAAVLDFFMLTFYVLVDILYTKLDWKTHHNRQERVTAYTVPYLNENNNIDSNNNIDYIDSSCRTELSYVHFLRTFQQKQSLHYRRKKVRCYVK